VRSFSRDEDKHKTVSKGCAAIRRGKLMGETFGIAHVHALGGAMIGGTPVTVRGVIYYGLQPAIFGASRLLETLNNMGGDSL
jgi:hypothetical protein